MLWLLNQLRLRVAFGFAFRLRIHPQFPGYPSVRVRCRPLRGRTDRIKIGNSCQ